MKIHALTDIWRVRHQKEFKYTWSRSTKNVFRRLDYFLISSKTQQIVTQTGIDPAYRSDHSAPWIMIRLENRIQKGPGYWKLNTSHLNDKQYYEESCKNIDETIQDNNDPELRWEMIKLNTRGYSIKYSARKKKSKNNELEVTNRKLKQTIEKQCENIFHNTKEIQNRIAMLQKEIEDINIYKTQGAMIRTQF